MEIRRVVRRARRPLVVWIALAMLVPLGAGALAQPCLIDCPTPGPTVPPTTPAPEPSASAEPDPEETATPQPSDDPGITLPTPEPTRSPTPTPKTPAPADELNADLPAGLEDEEEVTELVVPVLPRTPARNTIELVELLEPLTELGLPLEQVLIEGMGRFPVAGLAFYSDDWMNPRYNPEPHLHEGLDLFADFGTPIRAPDRGRITRLSNGGAGGVGLWMRGQDGTDYYFAHLESRVEDLAVGQEVSIGSVLGTVGDTGNALGGAPHLHFEIHRGGQAIPPKPSVDRWLDEAIELAPTWVRARRTEIEGRQELVATDHAVGASRTADLEANMVLTLLDPVGGSVGLLPRLELPPPRRPAVSERLMDELIQMRLHGFLFAPGSQGPH